MFNFSQEPISLGLVGVGAAGQQGGDLVGAAVPNGVDEGRVASLHVWRGERDVKPIEAGLQKRFLDDRCNDEADRIVLTSPPRMVLELGRSVESRYVFCR